MFMCIFWPFFNASFFFPNRSPWFSLISCVYLYLLLTQLPTFIGGKMGIMAVFQDLLSCLPRHHNRIERAYDESKNTVEVLCCRTLLWYPKISQNVCCLHLKAPLNFWTFFLTPTLKRCFAVELCCMVSSCCWRPLSLCM